MWTVAGEGPAPDLPIGWDSHRRFIADLLSVRRPEVAVDLTGGAGAAIVREVAPFVQFTAAGQAPADLVLAEQTWSGEVQVSQDALVLVDSWRADQACEVPVAILASGLAVVLPAGDQAWHWLLTDAFRRVVGCVPAPRGGHHRGGPAVARGAGDPGGPDHRIGEGCASGSGPGSGTPASGGVAQGASQGPVPDRAGIAAQTTAPPPTRQWIRGQAAHSGSAAAEAGLVGEPAAHAGRPGVHRMLVGAVRGWRPAHRRPCESSPMRSGSRLRRMPCHDLRTRPTSGAHC